MTNRFYRRAISAMLLAAALVLCLAPAQRAIVSAQQSGSKDSLTPTFWQRDPDADFEDEGRMHCAPTSVSDGLIYLTKAFGLKGLVPGTDHDNQIKLIKELADEFGTDPSIGGTNQDKVLTGLRSYMKSKGYEFNRLEIKTWRVVSESNKEFRLGIKPDMAWLRSAAGSKDTIVVFNFGWYKKDGDSYTRNGGHWINVVGVSGNEFIVHNPILNPEKQSENKSLELTVIDRDFLADVGTATPAKDADIVNKESGEVNLKGFPEGNGPGLPHGENVTAILDAVIVFSLKKSE
jgi:hypothetical protein